MKVEGSKIFSYLESDIISQHKKDVLHHNEKILFHTHDGYEIYLFLNGDADFFVETCGHHLQRGDLILSKPFEFHNVIAGENQTYERLFINLKENVITELSQGKENLASCFETSIQKLNIIHLGEDAVQQLVSLGNQLEQNLSENKYAKDLLTNALLTQILIFINRKIEIIEGDNSESKLLVSAKTMIPPLVEKILIYINQHLTENLSVTRLAEDLGFNSDYLSRIFKSFTGASLQHFILIKKINYAQKLLNQGKTATEACYLSGFNNYSNFSRSFSNITGKSPGKFQKLHQETGGIRV